MRVGTVTQLRRHPVKSMQGEILDVLELDPDGVPGDRCWGVRDSQSGRVLSGRRRPQLLDARARLDGDSVVVTLPDGRELHEDDEHTDLALSRFVGTPVHLARAKSDEAVPFDSWRSQVGTFNDGHPVHLLTSATAAEWGTDRFRPNMVIETTEVEDGWQTVQVGTVRLEVYKQAVRCTMTGLPRNQNVPRGVYARVLEPGIVRAGDEVVLVT